MSLIVTKARRETVGSCSFCNSNHKYVYVLTPKEGGLEIRMCSDCFDSLKRGVAFTK